MHNIAIIYMGGTFGCSGTPLAPMDANQFLSKLRSLPFTTPHDLQFFAAPSIKDSAELHAADWLRLACFIQHLTERFSHFIIIHGTDTLHYAAAFMHHLFANQLHIIFTGSQLPLFTVNASQLRVESDAWSNLTFAISQLQQLVAGVYVSFNQQSFYGHSCSKIHTQDFAAFTGQIAAAQSMQAYPTSLACIQHLQPEHFQQAAQLNLVNYYLSPIALPHLVKTITALQHTQIDILILQAFGAGNLPYSSELAHTLTQLITQGCHVILSSQVPSGALSQHYATGSWLTALNLGFDQHISQADTFARAILIYLLHGRQANWQHYWA